MQEFVCGKEFHSLAVRYSDEERDAIEHALRMYRHSLAQGWLEGVSDDATVTAQGICDEVEAELRCGIEMISPSVHGAVKAMLMTHLRNLHVHFGSRSIAEYEAYAASMGMSTAEFFMAYQTAIQMLGGEQYDLEIVS